MGVCKHTSNIAAISEPGNFSIIVYIIINPRFNKNNKISLEILLILNHSNKLVSKESVDPILILITYNHDNVELYRKGKCEQNKTKLNCIDTTVKLGSETGSDKPSPVVVF